MKKICLLIMFLSMLMQSISKGIIWVDFKLNQDYIAANLCENKADPSMGCNGKCQLNKKLNKDEAQKKASHEVRSEVVLFFEQIAIKVPTYYPFNTVRKYASVVDSRLLEGNLSPQFQPPII